MTQFELFDGLLFSPLALTAADLAERADGTPMVLLGERVDGPLAADHVVIDNVAAAREATAHLIAAGRRHVAAIGAQGRASGATARMRLEGYRLALAEAGPPYSSRSTISLTIFSTGASIETVIARSSFAGGSRSRNWLSRSSLGKKCPCRAAIRLPISSRSPSR